MIGRAGGAEERRSGGAGVRRGRRGGKEEEGRGKLGRQRAGNRAGLSFRSSHARPTAVICLGLNLGDEAAAFSVVAVAERRAAREWVPGVCREARVGACEGVGVAVREPGRMSGGRRKTPGRDCPKNGKQTSSTQSPAGSLGGRQEEKKRGGILNTF